MHKDCIVHDVEQGSDEWHDLRRGVLTATGVSAALTPTLKLASNDKLRQHVYEIAAQRISGYTEPSYVSTDMMRGHIDEIKARDLYSEHIAPVGQVGFITRDFGGFTIGYSPDGVGVVGDFGIEIKSRLQKYQIAVVSNNEIPTEHILQLQTGLLVTGWDYIDYISYSGGLPMWIIRCYPSQEYQDAILAAAEVFEEKVSEVMAQYNDRLSGVDIIETQRDEPEGEIYID